jgi:hypothetical protein
MTHLGPAPSYFELNTRHVQLCSALSIPLMQGNDLGSDQIVSWRQSCRDSKRVLTFVGSELIGCPLAIETVGGYFDPDGTGSDGC